MTKDSAKQIIKDTVTYLSAFADGVRDEKQAWLEGRRCHSCGRAMKPNPLTSTCPKCWEEE